MRGAAALGCALVVACGATEPGGGEADARPAVDGAAPPVDGSPSTSCFGAWAQPGTAVTAPSRPDPTQAVSLDFDLAYSVSDTFVATVVLEEIQGGRVVSPSDGPFSVDDNSGSWVELRDAGDRTLYTRGFNQLIPESVEVPPAPDGGFTNAPYCPEEGSLRLRNFRNDGNAIHLVLFQEAVDGSITSDTIELVRFALP